MKPRIKPLPGLYLSRGALIATKARNVVGALRAGADLHLHYEGGRAYWHLSTGADMDPEVALAVLDHPEIELLNDALSIGGACFRRASVIERRKDHDEREHQAH
jgi:hypothetical protein